MLATCYDPANSLRKRVTLTATILLTLVPISVTSLSSRSSRAPFRKGKPESRKREAVPARGYAIRSRADPGRTLRLIPPDSRSLILVR
jgi:hypothetical protein